MLQGPPDCLSCKMITACCNYKCQVGPPQTAGKNFIVENLYLLFHDIPTVQINQHGSLRLRDWIPYASNKKYWCQLVDQRMHPVTPLPDQPTDWGSLPSWHACRAANGPPPTKDTPNSNNRTKADRDKEQPRTPPRPQMPQHSSTLETSYKPKRWLNNPTFCSMVS
jgi:hypothetical protein